MTASEAWTVGRLLQWTTDFLKRHQAPSPRLDAEVLLAEALGCKRIDLYTAFESEPKEDQRAAFRDLVRRRAEGAPVAYLVGHREFYSLDFLVNPSVLIPRPETELLVLTLLDLAAMPRAGQGIAVADVGTGSGIIAVVVAKHLPQCHVTAVDNSPAALEVARANAAKHGVAEQIEFLESDLLSAVDATGQFDFVVSNPPYVTAAEWEKLAPDVKNFEPRQALVAGPRGTEVIERLLTQASAHLKPNGYLLIEISPMVHDAVHALLQSDDLFELAPTVKDLARLPRVVQAKRK